LVTFPAPPAAAPFPNNPNTTSTIPNGLFIKRNVSVVLDQFVCALEGIVREKLLVRVFLGNLTFMQMGDWPTRGESNNSGNTDKREEFHLFSKVDDVIGK
jgi:hypothetical protein